MLTMNLQGQFRSQADYHGWGQTEHRYIIWPKWRTSNFARLDGYVACSVLYIKPSLYLWTGITTEQDITGQKASPIIPDYVTASIGDLLSVTNSSS
jgi:hypothetical protein